MKRLLSIVLCALLVLSMTSAFAEETETQYRQLYTGEVTSLNYLTTATTNEFAIAANVIDTLIENDQYGNVLPSLAESWSVDEETGTVWTFKLRQDATWVDHNGEFYANVTAHDFVAAAKYILTASNDSSTAYLLSDYANIVGAADYYNSTVIPEEGEEAPAPVDWETVGIKALDDYTLQYTLTTPTPYFLSMTTYTCFMPVCEKFLQEKGEEFGQATGPDTLLYCGAYRISEFKPQETRVLVKNDSNWDADNVTIDKLIYTCNPEAGTIAPEMLLRGEVDAAGITTAIASEWLADETKSELIRPARIEVDYTYFYSFNFDPQFDAEYQPENWKLAVNNENFRKSFYYGLNRVAAKTVIEPDNPELLLSSTFTLPSFTTVDGVDYSTLGALAKYSSQDVTTLFNAEEALKYRDLAIAELTEAGAQFPIIVLMPYNPSSSAWGEENQVVEQQLEGLFNTDGINYIDIVVEPGPSSGFLSAVRRSGKYAFMKTNYGADFIDPMTFTDAWMEGNSFGFCDVGNPELFAGYNTLLQAAKAITGEDKIMERYLAFAEAEAYLIDHAIAIPYGTDEGGYTADRINPFSMQYSSCGVSALRYKGAEMLDAPMSTDQYYDAYDAWLDVMAAK